MTTIKKNTYIPAVLAEEKTATVKSKIAALVATYKQDASTINEVSKDIHLFVDHVQSDLPEGVDRVDGQSIRPILKEVIAEAIAKLPKPKEILSDV